MAQSSDPQPSAAMDRSEKQGNVLLLLLLAFGLVAAAIAIGVSERPQALILGLLAVLAMIGVFCAFAGAIGVLQFSGSGARNDLTKIMADTAGEGFVVVEDEARPSTPTRPT
jgi:two-component system cell cycle sensor histidine kinase/response regulator CckA